MPGNRYRAHGGKYPVGYRYQAGQVYLIHFASKFHHCQHYIGFTERPLGLRLREHYSGNGSKLTEAVAKAGIPMMLARTWPPEAGHGLEVPEPLLVDQGVEMWLKSRGGAPGFCPVCNPTHAMNQARYYTKRPACPDAWKKACRDCTKADRRTCPDARFLYVHPNKGTGLAYAPMEGLMLTVTVYAKMEDLPDELDMWLAQGQSVEVGDDVVAKEADGQKRELGIWTVTRKAGPEGSKRYTIKPKLTQAVLF